MGHSEERASVAVSQALQSVQYVLLSELDRCQSSSRQHLSLLWWFIQRCFLSASFWRGLHVFSLFFYLRKSDDTFVFDIDSQEEQYGLTGSAWHLFLSYLETTDYWLQTGSVVNLSHTNLSKQFKVVLAIFCASGCYKFKQWRLVYFSLGVL